jgi:hypothetical protein
MFEVDARLVREVARVPQALRRREVVVLPAAVAARASAQRAYLVVPGDARELLASYRAVDVDDDESAARTVYEDVRLRRDGRSAPPLLDLHLVACRIKVSVRRRGVLAAVATAVLATGATAVRERRVSGAHIESTTREI